MKTYEGKRTIDGLVVTVDGKPLDEHYEVKRLTKYGFEWTYEGESPQQLALAILFDYLGEKERAIALSEPFMRAVVANLDNAVHAQVAATDGAFTLPWRGGVASEASGVG